MRREELSFTFASGAALSSEQQVDKGEIVGVIMPAVWTAAAITFQQRVAAVSGGSSPLVETWGEVVDDTGAAVSIVLAAAVQGQYIGIRSTTSDSLRGPGMIRLRSGTVATPVNQAQISVVRLVVLIADER